MAYFDTSLELDPITEQQSTPVLPEERHVFELIGFERSDPDEYRREGGIKWTWRVFEEDGRTPFVFNDEQYQFFRTTNIDKKTRKPLFTVGSSANEWASALLGRSLGADAHFQVPELYGKRFSAMVVWKRQKKDPSKYSIELASLRHVPTTQTAPKNGTAKSAADQVSADPTDEQVDRALLLTGIKKSIERLKKLDADSGAQAAKALADSGDPAEVADLERLHEQIKAAIQKALDD